MDADVWSKHREERQKARLRDRGGMWKPVTPGRMAHDLLSKYRPRPPQESPTRPRKSAGARKSVGAGILPSRKSVGRKSVGAPRKSAAAAVAEDDDGDAHAAPKKAKPKAKAATKAKKLAIEPVKLANAREADDLPLAKPKSSKGKSAQAQPLFMTASEPAPAPVKPPKKPVHPALSGAPLLNQPPPPPRPPPQPEPTKKRPADAYAPTSEASEFVPSSPPPAKRARTKRRALAEVPEEEEGEEIDLRLADDLRSDDEEADEPKPKVVKIVKKKTKDAPVRAKPKLRAKKGAVVDDGGDDEPVPSGSKTKAKGATKGDSAAVPSTSKTKAKSKAKVKQTSEELDAHEDDGSVSSTKAKAKTVQDGSSKRATSKPAVSGAEDDDAEKLSSAKGKPADESISSASKRAKADKTAPPDDDSKSASKRKAKTKPDDDPKPKPPPRKRKAADEENAAPRKRKRLPSPPPAEQNPLRPAMTPHTRRRRIEAVLATEDSPVKTMHRQYDGLPDPIDCFL